MSACPPTPEVSLQRGEPTRWAINDCQNVARAADDGTAGAVVVRGGHPGGGDPGGGGDIIDIRVTLNARPASPRLPNK